MVKTILAYSFTPERLKALRMAAMLVRAQVRPVEVVQYNETLGYLAGVKGMEPAEEAYNGGELSQEMIIMCGFNRPDLDRLLVAIRKGALKQIDLKAMLTPVNSQWTALALYEELSKEHEYMHRTGKNMIHK